MSERNFVCGFQNVLNASSSSTFTRVVIISSSARTAADRGASVPPEKFMNKTDVKDEEFRSMTFEGAIIPNQRGHTLSIGLGLCSAATHDVVHDVLSMLGVECVETALG